ncbi:hypothetical protein [Paenibacillus sp. MBLB4367]|uniref:hypothetical protein n=1 Tax=Paenibacillus sp. MBLB4367 TaxID=3384767 RepID=UPI0039082F5E
MKLLYACQLLDNGAPLDIIQGMLSHEKASTTQIYGAAKRIVPSLFLKSKVGPLLNYRADLPNSK